MNVIYENIFKFISKHLHQYMRFVHYYANNLIYTDNFFNSAFSWYKVSRLSNIIRVYIYLRNDFWVVSVKKLFEIFLTVIDRWLCMWLFVQIVAPIKFSKRNKLQN